MEKDMPAAPKSILRDISHDLTVETVRELTADDDRISRW